MLLTKKVSRSNISKKSIMSCYIFFQDSCCSRSASLGECERILDTVQVLLSQQVSLSCSWTVTNQTATPPLGDTYSAPASSPTCMSTLKIKSPLVKVHDQVEFRSRIGLTNSRLQQGCTWFDFISDLFSSGHPLTTCFTIIGSSEQIFHWCWSWCTHICQSLDLK